MPCRPHLLWAETRLSAVTARPGAMLAHPPFRPGHKGPGGGRVDRRTGNFPVMTTAGKPMARYGDWANWYERYMNGEAREFAQRASDALAGSWDLARGRYSTWRAGRAPMRERSPAWAGPRSGSTCTACAHSSAAVCRSDGSGQWRGLPHGRVPASRLARDPRLARTGSRCPGVPEGSQPRPSPTQRLAPAPAAGTSRAGQGMDSRTLRHCYLAGSTGCDWLTPNADCPARPLPAFGARSPLAAEPGVSQIRHLNDVRSSR